MRRAVASKQDGLVHVAPPFDIRTFLDEPRRPAQLAAVSASGTPLLGSMWFLYDQGKFWFSTRPEGPIPRAASGGSDVAVIVDDFSPPDKIRQVRIRGRGQVEPHDPEQVDRIYRRYLGTDHNLWPEFFRLRLDDQAFALWTVIPTSGLAVAFPDFDVSELRWDTPEQSPLP